MVVAMSSFCPFCTLEVMIFYMICFPGDCEEKESKEKEKIVREGESKRERESKDNTSKDPLSQFESLQGIRVQVRIRKKWYSDKLN